MRNFVTFIAYVTLLVFLPVLAEAGTYTASAHGNSSYGVKRIDLGDYAQGNCAHCHEQHASLDGSEPNPNGGASGYLLLADSFSDITAQTYSQSDNVCFYCHSTTSSLQADGIVNNNYSATFGGAAAESTSIMAAFNQPSYHNLNDIKQYITGAKGTKLFADFPSGSNPCSGCHNVHIAEANKHSSGTQIYTTMSRPSDHDNLWGDDNPDERMTSATYGTGYQPPYYYGSSSLLEPDGVSSTKSTQAANTPDYNTFCIDCHNLTNEIWSSTLGQNLKQFNWVQEAHGGAAAVNSTFAEMLPPYMDISLGSYVLSCMDCHEPHGSSNAYLFRNSVNNNAVDLPPSSSAINNLCSSCHHAADDSDGIAVIKDHGPQV